MMRHRIGLGMGLALWTAIAWTAGARFGTDVGSVAVAQEAGAVLPPGVNPATCTDPVFLVVQIDKLDRSKTKAYGEALRSSQIVRRHGGEYITLGPPVLMLEGQWPADRGFVVERYPCLDAVKAFWYSDEYQQKLIPLRKDSGDYTVGVFKRFVRPN